MLRKRGYEPVVASDGVEGIEMTDRHQPRLVLMDLQMPRLDGFAAAAEIRRQPGGAGPVIVAVTANAGGDVRDACAGRRLRLRAREAGRLRRADRDWCAGCSASTEPAQAATRDVLEASRKA